MVKKKRGKRVFNAFSLILLAIFVIEVILLFANSESAGNIVKSAVQKSAVGVTEPSSVNVPAVA